MTSTAARDGLCRRGFPGALAGQDMAAIMKARNAVHRENPVFQAGFIDEPVLWRTIKTRKSDSGALSGDVGKNRLSIRELENGEPLSPPFSAGPSWSRLGKACLSTACKTAAAQRARNLMRLHFDFPWSFELYAQTHSQ